jgi:hypothetical protein
MHNDINYAEGYAAFLKSFLAVIAAPGYHDNWHDLAEEIEDQTVIYFSALRDTKEARHVMQTASLYIEIASKKFWPGQATLRLLEDAALKILNALTDVAPEATDLPIVAVLAQHDRHVNTVDAVLRLPPKKPSGRGLELPRADKHTPDKFQRA